MAIPALPTCHELEMSFNKVPDLLRSIGNLSRRDVSGE
jgi:hypothetical protein